MTSDLRAILDGTDTSEVEQTEEVAEVASTEVAEPETQPEPEKGEVQQQETPAQAATPAVESEEVKVPKAALIAERRKRQELERQLAERQAQQFDPSVFYQDPATIQAYVEQSTFNKVLAMSREIAREQYEDYEEMEELFAQEAERNPALVAELRSHPAPALFAYKTAKQLKTVKEAQDGTLEARIRAEIEAKLRAEFEQKAAQQKPPVPTDLSGARSAPVQTAVAEESLEDILKKR